MANSFTVLYRGAAATSSTTLYTVPSATQTLVTSIVVTNTDSNSATYTLKVGGIDIISGATISANDAIVMEVKQVMDAADVIAGSASATTVNFHISGLEIS